MDVIKYAHPSEQVLLNPDFQDVLPSGDSTLANIGAGSTITATRSDGSDADAVLFTKTRTNKVLSCILKNLVDGEEYTVTFLGQGASSTERFVKTYLVLVRKGLTGEF